MLWSNLFIRGSLVTALLFVYNVSGYLLSANVALE